MKNMLICACLVMALFVSTGTTEVWATTFNYTDYYDAVPNVFLYKWNTTYNYTHDINDNGFNPLTDIITSADITLGLRDDSWFDLWEYAYFSFDGQTTSTYEIDTGDYSFSISANLLQNDGLLDVTINRTYGDFYFDDSELNVQGNVIPEPGTFLLLGTGLLGFGIVARIRRKRK